MTWDILLRLIVNYGIPGAYSIWEIVQEHDAPTPEAWDKLNALALKSFDEYVAEAKAKLAGPPPVPPS